MTHKSKLHESFSEISNEACDFIKQSESRFCECWVPTVFIKDQLDLKKSACPKELGLKIEENPTKLQLVKSHWTWLSELNPKSYNPEFAILARKATIDTITRR